ncbi:phospholipase D family protein [Pseudomonas wadenswilerensis]
MSAGKHWPALSFLEHLRPGPGEQVELALLASYSADLGTLGAVLLALAGKDSDGGSGSCSDFVDAVDLLRGKVRVVIQRGRLAQRQRTPRMAAVLDQFVREARFNEAQHSWHAKAALVCLRREDGSESWRLWVGSRNLTECANRDLGLLLVSDAKGKPIPGIEDLALGLAGQAQLKGVAVRKLATRVATLTWRAPPGVMSVERLHWSDGRGAQPLPKLPANPDKVVVVSPFLDRNFLAALVPPGSDAGNRVLLSNLHEIQRIGPSMPVFDELLALDSPDYPPADAPVDDPASEPTTPEEELIGHGLHAKALFVGCGQRRQLWLGSANATMRAWTGHNVEVMAQLLINSELEEGLLALLGSAKPVDHPVLGHVPDPADEEETLLERARAQVAARWDVSQSISGDRLWFRQKDGVEYPGPHPDHPAVALEIGTLCGALMHWPAHQLEVDAEPLPLAELSDFVRVRVSYNGRGLCWLQRAPLCPEPGEARDRVAFVHFLGTQGFLRWIAAMLAEGGAGSDGDWRRAGPRGATGDAVAAWPTWMPTLEDMLNAWSPDDTRFQAIEQRVSRYLPLLREHARTDEAQEFRDLLHRFEDLWGTLCQGLGQPNSRRRRR